MEVDARQFFTKEEKEWEAQSSPLSRCGYDPSGDIIAPEANLCVARKAIDPQSGKGRYWVRFRATGGDAGHMFNPLSDDRERLASGRPHAGREPWPFREVGRQAFDYYLEFLTTTNLSFLRRAEREQD